MTAPDYAEHDYYRLVEDGHLTESAYLSTDVNEVARLYEQEYGSPLVDERELPSDLEAKAEAAREQADELDAVDSRVSAATDLLKQAADADVTTDAARHSLEFIVEMIGLVRHGQRWGDDAWHTREHADRLEQKAQERRQEAENER